MLPSYCIAILLKNSQWLPDINFCGSICAKRFFLLVLKMIMVILITIMTINVRLMILLFQFNVDMISNLHCALKVPALYEPGSLIICLPGSATKPSNNSNEECRRDPPLGRGARCSAHPLPPPSQALTRGSSAFPQQFHNYDTCGQVPTVPHFYNGSHGLRLNAPISSFLKWTFSKHSSIRYSSTLGRSVIIPRILTVPRQIFQGMQPFNRL